MKCDEEKPHCKRCTSTGRQCDGYAQLLSRATPADTTQPSQKDKVANSISLLSLHRPRHILLGGPGTSPGGGASPSTEEGRALQFFHEAAGPYLSGAMDPYFWTRLVMQFAGFEPAVKHSLIAISSLYEKLRKQPRGSDAVAVRVWDDSVALRHYNAGIRELKDMTSPTLANDGSGKEVNAEDKQPLVLLVCILFICIEFLQSNREAAIAHCKHGIAILQRTAPKYPWTREFLVPIFRRLSLFPYLFGNAASDFPDLVGLDDLRDRNGSETLRAFQAFSDAQHVLDYIFSRTLRLVRQGDAYRFGAHRHESPTLDLLADQQEINHMLDQWQVHFANFTGDQSLPDTPATQHFQLGNNYRATMSRCFLLTRYEICRVYVNMALEVDEMGYDGYTEDFGRIFEQLINLGSTVPASAKAVGPMIDFMFEMGFMPTLFLVTAKCRHLEMRLEALRCMRVLGLPRENLWELDTVFGLGKRIIEMEHGVQINDAGYLVHPSPSAEEGQGQTKNFPADHKRIRHSWSDQKSSLRSLRGQQVRGKIIGFVMQDEEGEVYTHTEFLEEKTGGVDMRNYVNL